MADQATVSRKVYFIFAPTTRLMKIGVANDVDRRLRALRGASPDRLILLGAFDGSQNDEAMLHGILSPHRKHGEWFDATSWVATMLNSAKRSETASVLIQRLSRRARVKDIRAGRK